MCICNPMCSSLKGIWSEIKKFLFCNCPCAFNSPLFRNTIIFYLNLFKAIKFDMNRPASNLQLGLGTNYDVGNCIQQYFLSSPGTCSAKQSNKRFKYSFFLQYSAYIFLQLRLMVNCQYNFLRHNSYPSSNCKLGAGLFMSITLRANLNSLK